MHYINYLFFRHKFHLNKAFRDAVLFGHTLTADRAQSLQIVDEIGPLEDLENIAVKIIDRTLGKKGLKRKALQKNKIDLLLTEFVKEQSKL